MIGNCAGEDPPQLGNGDVNEVRCDVEQPCVGMEFDSEDAAKKFYHQYATCVGFKMRIDQCRRSQVDKNIISRRLSCNKEGYYTKSQNQFGRIRKQHTSSRQGCHAMMLVKVNKFGKWVVTRFEKEHTHPLVFSVSEGDCKERKIQALTAELKLQDRLIKFYKEHLSTFLEDIELQTQALSTKIQVAVNNMREMETEADGKH